MQTGGFKKINHMAIIGFLLPFVAVGAAGAVLLIAGSDINYSGYSICYISIVPFLLLAGLVSSIRSIPRIADRGDKDYAFSGLVLNIFFICLYILSMIVFLFNSSN